MGEEKFLLTFRYYTCVAIIMPLFNIFPNDTANPNGNFFPIKVRFGSKTGFEVILTGGNLNRSVSIDLNPNRNRAEI